MSCPFRSKRQTTDVLRSRPQLAFTSNGSVGLLPPRSRCSLTSRSTISPSWKMTRWLRSWVWCPCSRALPPCGLTSQVNSPCRWAPSISQWRARCGVSWGYPGSVHGMCWGWQCWRVLVHMRCSSGTVASLHDLLCSAHPSHHGDSFSSCQVCMHYRRWSNVNSRQTKEKFYGLNSGQNFNKTIFMFLILRQFLRVLSL